MKIAKRPPETEDVTTGTLRSRFAVSTAGSQVRIRISNEEGAQPLTVSAASIGFATEGLSAKTGSLRSLTFGGKRDIVIPPGAPILSDPVPMTVTTGAELVASVVVAGEYRFLPRGGGLMAVAAGDQTLKDTLEGAANRQIRPLVTGAAVFSSNPPNVIVTLGDSITDGNRETTGVLRSWPEELNRRLAARRTGRRYSVVNAGIGGNRIWADRVYGPNALSRFDRDVLRIEGVSHVIILEGTNDIGLSGSPFFGAPLQVTADQIIAGYRQLITRAHARGIKVVMGTITPSGGSIGHSAGKKDEVRQAVNDWIRTSKEADAVIDFNAITRDPAAPLKLLKAYDSGDHLHPSEAGYKAMGDGIDLSIFD